ncbi:helix-turn-helix domain-containing protein [Allonocardiopsis opalescens]|uniref:helix-turn-helix domain-containing protein n=1 Tax=Allonocardiopsis opalescens TaxID=1144618 RepID=UPI00147310AE|nr:helix-turn-helix domain-containing protein [Allonocardiopsis opalescens]
MPARTLPLLDHLRVVEAGFFARAAGHECERPRGTDETIVLLCVDGEGDVRVGSTRVRIQRQHAAVLPPAVAHRYGAGANTPWSIWWMHVVGDDVPALLRSVLSMRGAPAFTVSDMAGAVSAMGQVREATQEDSLASRCLAAGAAWRLFALFTGEATAEGSRAAVAAVRDSIVDNPAMDVHVPELASHAGLSPSRFSVLFQEITGMGVVDFVRARRIERAKHLLTASELPVFRVAGLVGYADPLYFSRVFRSAEGMSPTAFRRRRAGTVPSE